LKDEDDDSLSLQQRTICKECALAHEDSVGNYMWCSGILIIRNGNTFAFYNGKTFELSRTVNISGDYETYVNSWYFYQNRIWIAEKNTGKLHGISVDDVTDVKTATMPVSTMYSFGETSNGMLWSDSVYARGNRYVFDGNVFLRTARTTADFDLAYPSQETRGAFVFETQFNDQSVSDTYVFSTHINPLCAVTIDNLETPVTKTGAQTMKVIYTVTQEE
jgi:hypothetical protein